MTETISHAYALAPQPRNRARIDDQTWDEYVSTQYALARMRGEDAQLATPGIGANDLLGGAA